MTSPATPSTPASQKVAQPTPTGTWRHPQFDEITRRQHATTFTDSNAKTILWNGAYLLGTFTIPSVAHGWKLFSPIFRLAAAFSPYPFFLMLAFRILLLTNIALALLPLFRRKDEIVDIPLTPSQRAALGLDPNLGMPQTPGTTYITPPRYARSTTRSSRSNTQSPLSGRSSPLGKPVSASNSPFSPNASPLLQKAIGGGAAARRLSYDRQSPLGASLFGDSSSSNTPGTPTPAPAKASVGLNNRWLYERGRGTPGGRGLFA
ncbi:hypothetical protein K432DRAFT_345127 [Lepidopterella palustris CBS 459.81]|uniref:Nuclear pore complex component n=1 Tax=Lepidopterella palustris CBS 459.81 TaxID=1314670 RepID=A0A8E2JJL8_9PEZI|nr:hypothetical protein K432DRAFT_345127 [Lepidopterella palustris CBS 459.81]